jgi:hypothetical protein
MTEHDYEKAMKLRSGVRPTPHNPAEYQAEYLEDTHCCITEAMSLLEVERAAGAERDYDYFEMED